MFSTRFAYILAFLIFFITASSTAKPYRGFTGQVQSDQTYLSDSDDTDARGNSSILSAKRAIYAIAHRVLTIQGVRDALSDGANALEIDVGAFKNDGWYGWHDSLSGKEDNVHALFWEIARQWDDGKKAAFVWLDVKTPVECLPDDSDDTDLCSVKALRKLAREQLKPKNIRVLYGMSKKIDQAYQYLERTLEPWEAINVDADGVRVTAEEVLNVFEKGGPKSISQRVMSKGLFWLSGPVVGSCTTESTLICGQLLEAVALGKFGRVFSWTATTGERAIVGKLLDVGIDGIIYGSPASLYRSTAGLRGVIHDIEFWLMKNSQHARMATGSDHPW